MRKNIPRWTDLPKPIFTLAPMSDVTDSAFRQMIARYGKPDVFFTEFVSADGLVSVGRKNLMRELFFTEEERPIVLQLFSAKPESLYQCAIFAEELGFDGIDINMGCPEKNICRQDAGAALIQNPELAVKIIRETRRGAGDLPVSVKTRLGYNTDILEEWLPHLLDAEPAAITIHGRTKKEMSDVPARWDRIGAAVKIARKLGSSALIIGNGDVADMSDARKKVEKFRVDGVMLGRAVFGNPWLFAHCHDASHDSVPISLSVSDRFQACLEHLRLFDTLYGTHQPPHSQKNFSIMKKHFKAYISGFNGAKALRFQLMETKNFREALKILQDAPIRMNKE